MKNIQGKIEILANIAIIVIALLIGFVAVKRYVLNDSPRGNGTDQITAGARISLPDVDWAKSRQTLLIVLSPGCHFCSESAPFYQRLVNAVARNNDVRLMAVFPQDASEGRRYLDQLGLSIAEVKQAPLNSIGVIGTPSLILVNNTGIVTEAWMGQLPSDKESEVLSRLGSNRATS